MGRINAVSAMAIMPGWPCDAALLNRRAADVQIGLHLVLCDELPLGPMPDTLVDGRLPSTAALARSVVAGRLNKTELRQEIDRQFVAFELAMGRPPDFVDGHKHCHLLPGIRSLVLEITAKRAEGAWLRSCQDSWVAMFLRPFRWKAFGSAFWSLGFRRAVRRYGLTCNDSFAGHYDFKADFGSLRAKFANRPGKFHVIMCHPGLGLDADDKIAGARFKEYEVLRCK